MGSEVLQDFLDRIGEIKEYNHPIFRILGNEESNATIFMGINTELYRARKINSSFEYIGVSKGFYGYDREGSFVPPVFRAQRINRADEACLYCADNSYYALIEVRPKIGDKISLSTLKVNYMLKIFDLTLFHSQRDMDAEKKNLFQALSELFSKPVNDSDCQEDYIPTQKIAEYIKQELHFDGIAYSSSLCPKLNEKNFKCTNYAIFNYLNCEPIKSNIIEYKSRYGDLYFDFINFEQIDNDPCRLNLIKVVNDNGRIVYKFKPLAEGGAANSLKGAAVVGLNNNIFVSTSHERYSIPMQIMQKGKIFEVYIGNGLRCYIDIGRETRCLFRLPSMLNHQLNDLTFFLSSVNIGKFWMGDRAKPGVGEIHLPITKDQKLDIDSLKKQLSFSMTVKSALLNLHVYKDFDMENANPSEKSIIDLLIHGVLYHEILNCDVEFSRFHVFKVQNITIYLIFEKISDHRYLIYDFFCKIVPIQCNLNNVTVITPQFSMLTPKALIEASNIDFDFIVSSYATLYSQENQDLPLRANYDVWNFLSAFYLSSDSRFLRAAEKLNDWVISKNYVKLSCFPLLNNLHIKKESGRWNLKCEQELKCILDNSKDNIVNAIASILLEEYNRAEEYYQRLEDEKKKIFLSLPICKLWNHC